MGVVLKGATIYTTNFPCVICAKMLINAGIKKIIYAQGYPDELSREMLEEAKMELVHMRYKGEIKLTDEDE